MTAKHSPQITELLQAWGDGDESALEKLMPLVYDELHQMAARFLRRQPPGHILQATALVNDAYLRLVNLNRIRWQDRTHFFAVSARVVRRILVDIARSEHQLKRGGGAQRVSLADEMAVTPERGIDLLALDEALTKLAKLNPRQAQVIELRFFGGLSAGESAATLKISVRTIEREWRHARLWLYRELSKTMMSNE
jgi:RNA polymerase sigma-70 factor, ECF subfamily